VTVSRLEALADTVTVLRDGCVVRTGQAREETPGRLVSAMLDWRLGLTFSRRRCLTARSDVDSVAPLSIC